MISYVGNQKDADDICHCAGNIISTVRGTMPYMRDMGIDPRLTGRSNPANQDAYEDDVIEQIEEWEERVIVDEISTDANEGKLEVKVVLKDNDE